MALSRGLLLGRRFGIVNQGSHFPPASKNLYQVEEQVSRGRAGLSTSASRVGACLVSYGRREFGPLHFVARSGQESIALGLPRVISPTRISPEGATRYGGNRLRTLESDRVRAASPFRAKRLFRLTQGKR
jgi:hypothetical protein